MCVCLVSTGISDYSLSDSNSWILSDYFSSGCQRDLIIIPMLCCFKSIMYCSKDQKSIFFRKSRNISRPERVDAHEWGHQRSLC